MEYAGLRCWTEDCAQEVDCFTQPPIKRRDKVTWVLGEGVPHEVIHGEKISASLSADQQYFESKTSQEAEWGSGRVINGHIGIRMKSLISQH